MYSSILILLICSYTSSATDQELSRRFFKEYLQCTLGFKQESNCEYGTLNNQVSYNLFKNKNGDSEKLDTRDLSQCPNPTKPVKIIIHGWMSSGSKKWVEEMSRAYFQKGDFNVISVNWKEPAHEILYVTSASNTQCIGHLIGNFIIGYLGPCQIPPENVHIIGHSLGAHVAGFAGKYVTNNTKNRKIYRISGLDMAGPCFTGTKPNNRLYKGDAHIVDVYHTDDQFGSLDVVGDYDFFINGGLQPQPGCSNFDPTCSHKRAVKYFVESINSDKFIASKCEKLILKPYWKTTGPGAIMGEDLTTHSPHGLYCIATNSKPPFAI